MPFIEVNFSKSTKTIFKKIVENAKIEILNEQIKDPKLHGKQKLRKVLTHFVSKQRFT